MKYITVEQFKEQPLEVQKVFDEYPIENTDLACVEYQVIKTSETINKKYIGTYEDVCRYIADLERTIKNMKKVDICNVRIYRLFTEGQLRQFIENKMEGKVEFYPDLYRGEHYYTIMIRDSGCGGDDPSIEVNADDVLQAYWKVACLIAKEEISNE